MLSLSFALAAHHRDWSPAPHPGLGEAEAQIETPGPVAKQLLHGRQVRGLHLHHHCLLSRMEFISFFCISCFYFSWWLMIDEWRVYWREYRCVECLCFIVCMYVWCWECSCLLFACLHDCVMCRVDAHGSCVQAQTVVLCSGCSKVVAQPTGGRAKLTEGCSFRKKNM